LIIVERPPNFDQILAAFPDADKPGVIFAFGEHIYNPSGKIIPAPLVAHEHVHLDNQKMYVNPELWWTMYIEDPEFRYKEELYAHVAEFKAQLAGLDRNRKSKLLMATAARLVAPLYNYVPPRKLTAAMFDIQRELNR
jgi:hypothetical protein